jgi:spore germination protein KC
MDMLMTGHRWRQAVAALLTCAICACVTGCYDRQELEQQAFVTALGIDKAPGGMIDFTLRFALPQNPAGGGGGGSSADTPLAGKAPVTYRAHSVTEALLIANSSVERQVSLTHLSNIIFGKSLAQEGLKPTMQALVRYREFRPTILVAVADGTAREVIANQKPMLDKTAGRLADGIALTSQKTGLIPVVYLQDLGRFVEGDPSGGVLPVFSINQKVKDDPKGEQGVKDGQDVFQPGAVPRAGGDPVEWLGAAVFRKDQLVGILNGRESIQLQFLKGILRNTKIDFNDPLAPGKHIGLSIRKERAPRYAVHFSNPMVIDVDVPLEADLLNIESGVDYTRPENRTKLEQNIQATAEKECTALLTKLYHDFDADVIPISAHVRGDFATDQQFTSYPWEERFHTADVRVHVSLRIRRFGVQLTPL